MTADLTFGIDVGTTNTKLVAVDVGGTVVYRDREPNDYVLDGETGRVDARAWWRATKTLLVRAHREIGAHRARGIGLSGTMSSVVPVDRGTGQAVAPAALIGDSRGSDRANGVDPAVAARVAQLTGNAVAAVFALGSMLDIVDRTHSARHPAISLVTAKDYVRGRLTGAVATDASEAYNTQLVARGGGWCDELVEALGIPPSCLPDIVPSRAIGGHVTPRVGAPLTPFVGLPVYVGAGDVPAALFAVNGSATDGSTADGSTVVTLGTAAVIARPIGLRQVRTLAPAGVATISIHPDSADGWYLLGSIPGTGKIFEWLRGLGWSPIDVAATAASTTTVVVSPYFIDPRGRDRGEFGGIAVAAIQPGDTLRDLAASASDAIAADVTTVLESMRSQTGAPAGSLTLTGGASRLIHERGVLAALSGYPTNVFPHDDASPYGAAQLAWGRAVAAAPSTAAQGPTPIGRAKADRARRARDRYRKLRHRLGDPTQDSP